jgi:hypothetical protein
MKCQNEKRLHIFFAAEARPSRDRHNFCFPILNTGEIQLVLR